MKYLFFSPYAAVWPHTNIETEIAYNLRKLGNDVTFLRCNDFLSDFCLAMPAFSVSYKSSIEDKLLVCKQCLNTKAFISDFFGFRQIDLELFLSNEIHLIENWLNNVDVSNLNNIYYENLNLGKLVSYEFIIHNKLASEIVPLSKHNELKSILRNSLLIYFAALNFFKKNSIDSVIIYNEFYSTNRIFAQVARTFGVRVANIQAAGPHRKMYKYISLYDKHDGHFDLINSSSWRFFSNKSWDYKQSKKIIDFYESLFDGSSYWVYSEQTHGNSRDLLLKYFSISTEKKVILVAISSEDEIFAKDFTSSNSTDNSISQFDWINTILTIANRRKDLHFIIRFHPRMFPNKREGVHSQSADVYLNAIEKMKLDNVSINLPTDNISIYDLATITDLLLNNISSVGYEFVGLGVPSLSHNFHLKTYPSEVGFHCIGLENYENEIDLTLSKSVSTQMLRNTYNWILFRYYYSNIMVQRGGWSFLVHFLKPFRIFYRLTSIRFNNRFLNLLINHFPLRAIDLLKEIDSEFKIESFIVKDSNIDSESVIKLLTNLRNHIGF